MGTLRSGVLLSAAALGAFVVDAALRGPATRPARAVDGFERPTEVRVGISGAQKVAEVELSGDALLGPQGVPMSGLFVARREGDRIVVEGTSYEAPLRVAPAGGPLCFGERAYRGSFEVALREEGLGLLNVVAAEDYLAGVLGGEMGLTGPEAALKAQAVAARTYVLYEIAHGSLRGRGLPYDVFDDQRSQVYEGMEHESAAARELVEQTAGMVLRHEGRIFKAFYASSCGGATDSAWDLLRHSERIAPLGGAECGYCRDARHYRWTMKPMAAAEVSRRLGRGKVISVSPGETLASGRVRSVSVRTDRGTFLLDANEEFRRKLDPGQIRSTLWEEVALRDGKLHLRGRGWGHGVGMCQSGAMEMARQGATAEEILGRYYPGAEVVKIY